MFLKKVAAARNFYGNAQKDAVVQLLEDMLETAKQPDTDDTGWVLKELRNSFKHVEKAFEKSSLTKEEWEAEQ